MPDETKIEHHLVWGIAISQTEDGETVTIVTPNGKDFSDFEDLPPYSGVPKDKHEAMIHVFRLVVTAAVQLNENAFNEIEGLLYDMKKFKFHPRR